MTVILFTVVMLIFFFYRPGVIITEVHKRAGLDEEQYKQVRPDVDHYSVSS